MVLQKADFRQYRQMSVVKKANDMVWITHRDINTLSDILPSLYATTDLDAFPQQTLRALARVVPAEIYGYNEVDLQRRQLAAELDPPEARFPDDALLWALHMHEHPVLRAYQRTHDGSARKISDYLSQRQFHQLPLYQEVYRPLRTEDQWAVVLASPSSRVISLTVSRSRRTFSERDRLLLNLLRLHIIYAHQNAVVTTQRNKALGLKHGEGITRREADILAALAQGKTNKEIANSLGLSVHTVRSRLEDLYGKLGVNTRTAAVRRFLEARQVVGAL